MQKLSPIWQKLSGTQRIITGVSAAVIVLIITALFRMASQPNMNLLYAGLAAEQAGEIVKILDQKNEVYEIRNDSIFVPSSNRDAIRMELASQGLPSNSGKGYELLDSLSGFGTTSQMFTATLLRAKEGELARTISASPLIETARVHVAIPRNTGFSRKSASSASIFITSSGSTLSDSQARALKFLVASAFAGLLPNDVSVINEAGELLGDKSNTNLAFDQTHNSLEMKLRIQRLLEARVGTGNAIVEVNIERATQTETIKERRFDPESRVAISVDNEESTTNATNGDGAGVTVASNLPDGNAGGTENSQNESTQVRERTNFEVSETQREIHRAPGTLTRISVAALVNGIPDPANTSELVPRPEAELAELRDLIRSAVGYDKDRGDVISLKSLGFVTQEPIEPPLLPSPFFSTTIDPIRIAEFLVPAIVAILIGFFVLRPILNTDQKSELDTPIEALPIAVPKPDDGVSNSAAIGEILPYSPQEAQLNVMNSPNGTGTDETPVARLRELIDTRQDETIEILRHWLDKKEEEVT